MILFSQGTVIKIKKKMRRPKTNGSSDVGGDTSPRDRSLRTWARSFSSLNIVEGQRCILCGITEAERSARTSACVLCGNAQCGHFIAMSGNHWLRPNVTMAEELTKEVEFGTEKTTQALGSTGSILRRQDDRRGRERRPSTACAHMIIIARHGGIRIMFFRQASDFLCFLP